jgi:hypothetical protein
MLKSLYAKTPAKAVAKTPAETLAKTTAKISGSLPVGADRKFVSPYYATLFFSLFLPAALLISKTTISTFETLSSRGAKHNTLAINDSKTYSPAVNIWAWERDEDLSFIDPVKVTVSYFAGMIYVRGASIEFRPRTQKLKLPTGTQTVPVFRIETLRIGSRSDSASADALDRGDRDPRTADPGTADPGAADYVVKTIVERLKDLPPSNMVQIDFDALQDERSFYHAVLSKLRHQLPATTKISITALGSWLLGDKWLQDGDADEVVAMLFSIGPDRTNILNRLQRQKLDSGTNANLTLGISANETSTNRVLFGAHLQNQFNKLYIFNSRPWTRDRFNAITKEAFHI